MALSALIVLGAAAVCYPFSDWVGYRSVALILLLVVSVLAMRMELPAVLLAALLSALIWDFFFIPPHFTFTIGDGEDLLLIIMYFIVATLNGVVNYRLRQLEQVKREKAEREKSLNLYNTLFSSLSHDLRTPIAAILGAADTLLENASQLSEKQREDLLLEISKGSLRLSEQVENLLNMSRIEAGGIHPRKEWCDLEDLVFGAVKKVSAEDKNHPIEVAIAQNFPLVQLDFGLTAQILHNLLSNAVRHTPEGTKIRVSAALEAEKSGHFDAGEDDSDLHLVKENTAYRLQLEVRDTGEGFPEAEIGRVFDKFYRTATSRADGTGLGLFVARGFTEAQGGEISLRNAPEGGACFTLEFPTAILNQAVHHD